mgnify:CR=1 FL=1
MGKKKTAKKTTKTVKHPAADESWKENFSQHTFKTNFVLTLSQSMIEFLCAVAEDVMWDRTRYLSIHKPDNWIASENALIKRGLIIRKCESEKEEYRQSEFMECSLCKLTPAGEAVVQLFKVTGVFVESDNAIIKKSRA